MDDDALQHLLTWTQDGVVSRAQLERFGARDHDVERLVRRRELVRIRRGIYLNHTGAPTRIQQEWMAVLAYWPAALSHHSALPGRSRTGPIHVAYGLGRTIAPVPGVVAHRMNDLERRVRWNGSPPHVRVEHALIDVMSSSPTVEAMFEVLSNTGRTREVWPELIRGALAERERVAQRRLIDALVADWESGIDSVLERGWLQVAKAHGLPPGELQVRAVADGRRVVRDVLHAAYRTVLELDGFRWHGSFRAHAADAQRDLIAAAEGLDTVRLTYPQVCGDGCGTTRRVGGILTRRGWTGTWRPCQRCP